MTIPKSRFSNLAQAIKDRTAETDHDSPIVENNKLNGAGIHKPAAALGAMGEALRDRINRLETELAESSSEKESLIQELQHVKALSNRAGDAVDEFRFLDVESIIDRLPKDRLYSSSHGQAFDDLFTDIEINGQNDAITVRKSPDGKFEIAAGRRRLEVCRRLKRSVLARIRDLDDRAMLGVQFSENERRADISALERAQWFIEVRNQMQTPAKEIAAQFGIDPSTFSLYLRIARFPREILERLQEPQRLAMLPARRIMEALDNDSSAFQRIVDALDGYRQSNEADGGSIDPAIQIDILIRAADSRTTGPVRSGPRTPVPERRHIVHQGRRIGTLTRNGGQWVFRFATSIPDNEVQLLAERLATPVAEPDNK